MIWRVYFGQGRTDFWKPDELSARQGKKAEKCGGTSGDKGSLSEQSADTGTA